jgi:hypothetical protein
MSTFTLSPNMNLPIPTVGVDPGPDWATNINASLSTVDAHTHASGSGVPITPDALNINSDLPFNSVNNITLLRSLRFASQVAPISLPSDLGCLYESGDDLYYNDGAGNQVRITSGGNVAGATGTITGLPSGTASASFQSASGSFLFQQATSTAANIDAGSLAIRYPGSYPTPAGNYIQIQAPSSLATGYSLTLPAVPAGGAGAYLTSDTLGNISYSYVDGATLVVNGIYIQVNAGGIDTPELANGAVTQAKKAIRVTTTNGSDPGAGGIMNCSSSSTFTTTSLSYVQITNQLGTLTTTGNPVVVELASDDQTAQKSIIGMGGGGAPLWELVFCVDGVETTEMIGNWAGSDPLYLPPSSYRVMYSGLSAAAHTFSVKVRRVSTGTIAAQYLHLRAYEL